MSRPTYWEMVDKVLHLDISDFNYLRKEAGYTGPLCKDEAKRLHFSLTKEEADIFAPLLLVGDTVDISIRTFNAYRFLGGRNGPITESHMVDRNKPKVCL